MESNIEEWCQGISNLRCSWVCMNPIGEYGQPYYIVNDVLFDRLLKLDEAQKQSTPSTNKSSRAIALIAEVSKNYGKHEVYEWFKRNNPEIHSIAQQADIE